MPVYTVEDRPKLITGVNIAPYIMRNSGSETVYIGQDSSLTVASRAFSLTPGSSMQWPGKSTEIWAMTASGVSELEILFDSQATYIPGPENVTVDGGSIDATIVGSISIAGNSTLLYNGAAGTVCAPCTATPGYEAAQRQFITGFNVPGDVQSLRITSYFDGFVPVSQITPNTGYVYLVWRTSGAGIVVYQEVVPMIVGQRAIQVLDRKANYLEVWGVNPINQPYVGNITIRPVIVGLGVRLPVQYRSEIMSPLNTGLSIRSYPFGGFALNYSDYEVETPGVGGTQYLTVQSLGGQVGISIRGSSIPGGGSVIASFRAWPPETGGAFANTGFAWTSGPFNDGDQISFSTVLPNTPIQLLVQRTGASGSSVCRFAINTTTLVS